MSTKWQCVITYCHNSTKYIHRHAWTQNLCRLPFREANTPSDNVFGGDCGLWRRRLVRGHLCARALSGKMGTVSACVHKHIHQHILKDKPRYDVAVQAIKLLLPPPFGWQFWLAIGVKVGIRVGVKVTANVICSSRVRARVRAMARCEFGRA